MKIEHTDSLMASTTYTSEDLVHGRAPVGRYRSNMNGYAWVVDLGVPPLYVGSSIVEPLIASHPGVWTRCPGSTTITDDGE